MNTVEANPLPLFFSNTYKEKERRIRLFEELWSSEIAQDYQEGSQGKGRRRERGKGGVTLQTFLLTSVLTSPSPFRPSAHGHPTHPLFPSLFPLETSLFCLVVLLLSSTLLQPSLPCMVPPSVPRDHRALKEIRKTARWSVRCKG